MPSSVFDSALFRDGFGSAEMRAVFCDETFVRRCIDVEVALARAQSRLGLIPKDAGEAIAMAVKPQEIDYGRLKIETDNVGYPIVGLVHQIATQAGEAGRYVHWGATTQDIMDTAVVLQIRDALALIDVDLASLDGTLTALSRQHRDTVTAARTHLQQALPTTFGQKTAVWLSMIRRHRERLAQLRPRVLVGQLGGAAGTLASLGDQGLAVSDALMDELDLGRPHIAWHVARDSLAEAACFCGLVTGSLGKIATDVMLLMQTEVAEAFEPFAIGRGSSSTMPQKRNPISCELIIALARAVRSNVGLMLDAMLADLERATGPWHLEWIALPECFIGTAGALKQARFMLEGLVVDTARMRRNLDLTGGLIVAEAVMMAIAPHTGRGAAHDLVYGACRSALEAGSSLLAELRKLEPVTHHLSEAELTRLVDPANYVGSAPAMVDRLAGRE